nr:MAG TPA: hypothetical protein [Caudoviricetes sp.]
MHRSPALPPAGERIFYSSTSYSNETPRKNF